MEITIGGFYFGPWNIAFAIAIAVISTGALMTRQRDMRLIASAFFVSWIMAHASYVFGNPIYAGLGLTIAAALCFCGKSQLSVSIALLYSARIGIVALTVMGVIGNGVMWAWTEVFLALQLLLAAGGSVHGYVAKRRHHGASVLN